MGKFQLGTLHAVEQQLESGVNARTLGNRHNSSIVMVAGDLRLGCKDKSLASEARDPCQVGSCAILVSRAML